MSKNDKLFQRRKSAATAESLRRRAPRRKPNKRILIVCEGEQTERRYFQALVDSLNLQFVDVEIHDKCDSAPISVVRAAERKAKDEGTAENGGYESVFCVFDRDTHASYEAAKSKIDTLSRSARFPVKNINAVTSVPCFEYWFLLHFRFERAPFVCSGKKSAGDNLVSLLKQIKCFATYKKNVTEDLLDVLLGLTQQALANAKLAIGDAIATGEYNPSTLVFRVVEFLQAEKLTAEREAAKSK